MNERLVKYTMHRNGKANFFRNILLFLRLKEIID